MARGQAPWPESGSRRRRPTDARSCSAAAALVVAMQRRARSGGSSLSNVTRSPGRRVVEATARRRGGTGGRVPSVLRPGAVDGVADERMPDRREVNADLVGATGLQATASRATSAGACNSSTTSYSVRAGRPSATTAILVGSAGSRPIGASTMPWAAAGWPHTRATYRRVGRVGGELGDQATRWPRPFGRRRAVPSSRRRGGGRCPGRSGVADPGDVGKSRQQAVDQRAVGVAGAGMDHQPGRLVDDDRPPRRRGRRRTRRPVVRLRAVPASGSPSCRWPRGAPASRRTLPDAGHVAVDLHGPAGDQLGGGRSADVGEEGDHPVEALPVRGRRAPLRRSRRPQRGQQEQRRRRPRSPRRRG